MGSPHASSSSNPTPASTPGPVPTTSAVLAATSYLSPKAFGSTPSLPPHAKPLVQHGRSKLQRWCELRPSRAGSTGSGGSRPSFCDALLLTGGSAPMATSVVLGAAANVQDGVASAAAVGTKIILQRASRGPLGDAAQRRAPLPDPDDNGWTKSVKP
ncbi:hypothetical protein PR202_ga11647 [Eleusine coracana subsp. coracana]|uniref:Uncharacterized protein n=1 Tax=Eleusine coracana subsp. coracana TaxID=191504 RepID=A0AAV5CA13_ELECO|nr:hypothetical protein PR202_ga11647 [Eleusine coracana subsp. coracana]